MDNFEWYKPEIGKSYMSIGKCRVGLSKKLFNDIGKPKYIQLGYYEKTMSIVQLGYYEKTMSIVIKPCNESSEYKIEVKNGKYPPRINNKGFIKFLIDKGWKIENKAKRYEAIWNEETKVGYIK